MTDLERHLAAEALMNWLESQNIMPADAAAVFSTVLAICITEEKTDPAIFEQAAELFKKLYLLDIAEVLRMRQHGLL